MGIQTINGLDECQRCRMEWETSSDDDVAEFSEDNNTDPGCSPLNMTTIHAQPTCLGVLSNLQLELREQIYSYHLALPEPICMRPRKSPSLSASHMAVCKTNRHVKDRRTGSLQCINPTSGEIQLMGCPSRLALLATSKIIYNEAVHIYYRQNHLVWKGVGLWDG
ncbi:hypothetical protein MMC22_003071 [Lobaria immixta]|nr:hypothetical protein [Lobaria immixta]